MDSFETFSNYSFDSQKVGSLCCPISARTCSVLLSSKNDSLVSIFLVPLSSIEYIESLSAGDMNSLGSHFALHHFVKNSNICKSASGHDQVVASSGSVCVEISFLDSSFFEEPGSRRWEGNISSGGDVVSRDGISKKSKDMSIFNFLNFGESLFNWFEEGRVMDVSWLVAPLEMNWFFHF